MRTVAIEPTQPAAFCDVPANTLPQEILAAKKAIEKAIIETLSEKGFQFATKQELEGFIAHNCHCVDDHRTKTRIYYVNGQPFFMHVYGTKPQPFSLGNKIYVMKKVPGYCTTL